MDIGYREKIYKSKNIIEDTDLFFKPKTPSFSESDISTFEDSIEVKELNKLLYSMKKDHRFVKLFLLFSALKTYQVTAFDCYEGLNKIHDVKTIDLLDISPYIYQTSSMPIYSFNFDNEKNQKVLADFKYILNTYPSISDNMNRESEIFYKDIDSYYKKSIQELDYMFDNFLRLAIGDNNPFFNVIDADLTQDIKTLLSLEPKDFRPFLSIKHEIAFTSYGYEGNESYNVQAQVINLDLNAFAKRYLTLTV